MEQMYTCRDSKVAHGNARLWLIAVAILTLFAVLPGWAAAPTGFLEANIGPPPVNGSVVVNADGTWTVMGSGNAFNGNTADQLYFLYKSVKGDGSAQFKLTAQAPTNGGGGQYVGLMVRATTDPGSVFAGPIMSTSAVNFIHRDTVNTAAVRDDGDGAKNTFPKFMMVQRVGKAIQAFESDDGKIWDVVKPALELTLPADQTTVMGLAVSSRGSIAITAQVDKVQVLEGVVSVSGLESASTTNATFLIWEPIKAAVGYTIYRGDQGATYDKMKALGTSPAAAIPYYVDTATSTTPLKDLSYVVAPVFKAADGTMFEGPAVRAR